MRKKLTLRKWDRVAFALFTLLVLLAQGCQKTTDFHTPAQAPAEATKAQSKALPELPSTPADFVAEITNPYLAFARGKTFRYEGETDEGLETIVVEVTQDTKTILGVATTVVHDQAFLNGELIEDTFDWFAQDKSGTVWYFGEDSKEIENGVVVSTEGSWQAGVNGARPGIIMLAQPRVGMKYQQEFAEDVAEDMAKVLSLSETVGIGLGTFTAVLETMEWTPLEPGAREHKFYKPGLGLVLELAHKGGGQRLELVSAEN